MPILQTPEAARLAPILDIAVAGPMFQQTFTFVHSGANITAAADKIEMGALPAHAQLLEIEAIQIGMTAGTTFAFGFMTGEFSSLLDTRTVGNELLTAQVINTLVRVPPHTYWNLPKSGLVRSIGCILSANEAAAANGSKRIHLTCRWRY
jgi:hypothetical protein